MFIMTFNADIFAYLSLFYLFFAAHISIDPASCVLRVHVFNVCFFADFRPPFNSFILFFCSFLSFLVCALFDFETTLWSRGFQRVRERGRETKPNIIHCIADEKLLFSQQWWFHCGHKTELERILCSFSCVAVLFIFQRLLCHVAHCFRHAVQFHCWIISTIPHSIYVLYILSSTSTEQNLDSNLRLQNPSCSFMAWSFNRNMIQCVAK